MASAERKKHFWAFLMTDLRSSGDIIVAHKLAVNVTSFFLQSADSLSHSGRGNKRAFSLGSSLSHTTDCPSFAFIWYEHDIPARHSGRSVIFRVLV